MKNKNKSRLSRFFSHDITLLVLAFLISFSAWFVINLNSDVSTPRTINHVNITLELPESAEQEQYEIFLADSTGSTATDDEDSNSALQASVTVRGSKVIVGSLEPSDLTVTTSLTDAVITPGEYTTSLIAKKNGLKTNYEIVSVTPSTISVYIDRRAEQTFTIDNQITVQLSDADHYASTTLSQKSVNVTGPESMVNQIKSVAVIDNVSGKDSTVQENLVFLDDKGNKLNLPYVTSDIKSVEVNISVLPIKTVSLGVDVVGAPSGCPDINVTPESVKIAGPQDTLNDIKGNKISIGKLDFSELSNEDISQSYPITLPTGCKVISGETSANVSVNLEDYVPVALSIKPVSKLDSDKYSTEFITSEVTVRVYGPEDSVSSITPSNVTAVADFSGLLDGLVSNKSVSLNVPLKVTPDKDFGDCWVYGTYIAEVKVTKK